jgi:anti-sigma regulatory factor (Ser/Thr protein kinase)
VEGTVDALAPIRTYVEEVARLAGLAPKQAWRLKLAVDEIASNSVLHGYAEAGLQGPLIVSAELGGDEVRVILEDEGAPFDPRDWRPSAPPLEGGFGIPLCLAGVDRFEYERVGNRNRHQFVVVNSART